MLHRSKPGEPPQYHGSPPGTEAIQARMRQAVTDKVKARAENYRVMKERLNTPPEDSDAANK